MCAEFLQDVDKGYTGCRWFFMKKNFENALKSLHEVQKMGPQEAKRAPIHTNQHTAHNAII